MWFDWLRACLFNPENLEYIVVDLFTRTRPWVVTDLSILQSEHSAGGQGEARGEVDGLQRGPGDWGLTEKLKSSGIRNEMCLV